MLDFNPAREPEYYLTPDYPTAEGELEVRTGGKASQMMGLSDGFTPLAFLRLSKGLNPETGGKLTARLRENRLAATDITANVPKPVSILIEVMEAEGVKEALWEANSHVMQKTEKEAMTRVRKGGKQTNRKTGNIAFSSFYHPGTRPAKDDNLPDPHAHIHNYVYNVTWDKAERQWKALKLEFVDKPKMERAFHKRLAKNLRKLGYDARFRGGVFELRGFDQETCDRFSRRHFEVREDADKRGYKSPKAIATVAQATRSPKRSDVSMQDVRRYWVSRLTGDQFGRLADYVKAARKAAKRVKLRERLASRLDKLRRLALQREEATSERGRGFSR